jgi:ABC-type multidrug transport system ATPase subunit/ABC-type multidrug transport system permease subunit
VNHEIPTVVNKFRDLLMTPVTLVQTVSRVAKGMPDSTVAVPILTGCKGVLTPGSTTLMLAPPGHGKTTFLKALAGRLPADALEGSVSYSGVDQRDLLKRGVYLKLLANYVDQLDVHLPFLTVRETAEFACINSTVDPSVMENEMLTREAANRVERVIQLLNLSGCANTLVGNNLVRGVSGGEKKRVTVAEALVSNARLLCMDEISTGLDASVTYDICASIRTWAKEMRGTVIIALLQPTPEVYNLFDDVLLMREGAVVYHGPRKTLPGYLSGLGFTPPGDAAGEDNTADVADWLVELLASPTKLIKKQIMAAKTTDASKPDGLASMDSSVALAELANMPRTTADLVDAWTSSPICQQRLEAPPIAAELELKSRFAQAQYGRPYPRAGLVHFQALLKRQFLITARNGLFVTARIMSSVVISTILGSVWFNLDKGQGLAKFGMLLFCVLQVAFANFSEVPFAVEYKFIAYKHIQAGMYPPWAYTLAATIVQLPTAAVESAAFSVILYFMVGLVRDGGRWAFFYLVLWLINVGIGSLFRLVAYVVPNYETAQTAPGPFIAIQVIFAGFLIPPSKMGTMVNGTPWLIFMYYASVFAYALRCLAHNEFYSPPYSIYAANATGTATMANMQAAGAATIIKQPPFYIPLSYYSAGQCATYNLGCSRVTYGEEVLHSLNINLPKPWKWGGVGFLAFFVILMNFLSGIALGRVHIERNIGTSRVKDEEETASGESVLAAGATTRRLTEEPKETAVVVSPAGSVASVLPFTPMTVTWRDLKYTVQLNKNLGGGSKTLLQGVSGIAVPGRLISLMGASGAGKSTLLDVIAGRKTAGKMEGNIVLNGFPRESKSFARLTAYCEQQDIHNSFATVLEALEFSAALRLSSTVDAATRSAFVQEVLDLLELRPISSRLVGEVGAANGLAPGQRKILTIGVELVSNAPILFLDEPTSGLDARAAQVVIREVRKITDTGRTVITTIHQPSAEIFFKFDEILLMQRGGYMAYFGPVGRKGASLVTYIESVPGVRKCPRNMNPASWMLDVLAGTDSSSDHHQAGGARASMDGKPRASMDGKAKASLDGKPAAEEEQALSGTALDGTMLQERLFASPQWQESLRTIDAASQPAAGATAYKFASVYAQPFPKQLATVLRRAMVSYNRNVGYVYTKTMVLWGLMIMFGVIYYKIMAKFNCTPASGTDPYQCQNDPGSVQSIVSVVFLTSLFIGILCMNTMLPVLIRERAVFYRERFSYMYQPEAHALSYALAEIPWLILLVFLIVTGFYFMVGFNPKPGYFFFYIFLVSILAYVFICMGQWAAAYFPTAEVAQAVIGLVIPLAFLFGGLYLPKSQIPNGSANGHPHIYWLWAYYVDPISYALEGLVPQQFYDQNAPSMTNHLIKLPYAAPPTTGYQYVSQLYSASFGNRFKDVGYLACFIAGLQLSHLYATRYKQHIDR